MKSRGNPNRNRNVLEARQQSFDEMKAAGFEGTSKYVPTSTGKMKMFHRPGSKKK